MKSWISKKMIKKQVLLIGFAMVIFMMVMTMSPQPLYAATTSGNTTPTDDKGDGVDTPIVEPTPSSTSEFVMVGGNWITPVAVYGKSVNIVLPIVNMGNQNINNVIVTPVISSSTKDWPFEILTSGYSQTIRDLPGKGNGQSDFDRRRELTWTLQTRGDALNGYHKLQFSVLYEKNGVKESTTLTTYVKVIGASGSGNVENGGASLSTPRVIVTGFTTEPSVVKAGDTFKLMIHLKNTSKRTSVNNMVIHLAAAAEGKDADTTYSAFLPTSGSNTVYIDKIGKGSTSDVTIEMTAKADLLQKPYVLEVKMEFEDENYAAFTAAESVSIPIKQNARFDISTPEVMPTEIMVGGESNIMFSIYNLGKTTLYNVKVAFKGDNVSGGDTFVGKIDAGATGNVDAMVMGTAATTNDGTIQAVISYEDESGKEFSETKDVSLFVMEDVPMDEGMIDGGIDGGMVDDPGMQNPGSRILKYIVIVVIIIVVLGIIGTIILVVILKKKKAKKEEELVNLLDECEGEKKE